MHDASVIGDARAFGPQNQAGTDGAGVTGVQDRPRPAGRTVEQDQLRPWGEKAMPVEQALRDLRINRIFEGSTEIMHLLIAREAVDTHLAVAGGDDRFVGIHGGTGACRPARRWLPRQVATQAGCRRWSGAAFADIDQLARHLRYVDCSSRRLARSTFYGMARWQA
jgi:hypothetical protein